MTDISDTLASSVDAASAGTELEQVLFEVRRVIVGQDTLVERLLTALLAGGHCLLEGVPGVAKTLAAQTLATALEDEDLRIVSGGTDNHLMLVDLGVLGSDQITGKSVEKALDQAGIHCNKNMIPFDPRPALVTSGIRLGTPAATTAGESPGTRSPSATPNSCGPSTATARWTRR